MLRNRFEEKNENSFFSVNTNNLKTEQCPQNCQSVQNSNLIPNVHTRAPKQMIKPKPIEDLFLFYFKFI